MTTGKTVYTIVNRGGTLVECYVTHPTSHKNTYTACFSGAHQNLPTSRMSQIKHAQDFIDRQHPVKTWLTWSFQLNTQARDRLVCSVASANNSTFALTYFKHRLGRTLTSQLASDQFGVLWTRRTTFISTLCPLHKTQQLYRTIRLGTELHAVWQSPYSHRGLAVLAGWQYKELL